MDRKSVIVLAVCFVLFVLWAQLVPVMYPPKPVVRTNTVSSLTNAGSGDSGVVTGLAAPKAATTPWVAPKPGSPEELLVVSNDVARYTFTSHGGGLKLVELLRYPEFVSRSSKSPGLTNRVATLNGQALQPVLALSGAEALVGDGAYRLSNFTGNWPNGTNAARPVSGVRAEKLLTNGLFVVKEFELAADYLVNVRVRFENRSTSPLQLPGPQWVVGTATPMSPDDKEDAVGLQWFKPGSFSAANQSRFTKGGFACVPGTPLSELRVAETNLIWATAHNQFFLLALMPKVPFQGLTARKYDLPPAVQNHKAQFAIETVVDHPGFDLQPGTSATQEFTVYAGPRKYRTLELIGARMNNELERVMEFGFFGFFAKFLLLSMNGLNALGLSYGLAIIAITVIIKLLFWPLTQASTRSMKRMQKLQPQMKAIQEKYKDDPAKMNKKMMEFMKENKVSPLGGCLPLLFQIPVFIGFFTMVKSAIELRGATFLWAHDLSRPDTIFTIPGLDFNVNPLPLMMGATMLWQSSLTPPSPGMDPAQQKLMRYFPLLFLFMLYNYSAGLTLYWTVQNLLSIAQMKLTKAKDDPTPATTAPVASSLAPKKKK